MEGDQAAGGEDRPLHQGGSSQRVNFDDQPMSDESDFVTDPASVQEKVLQMIEEISRLVLKNYTQNDGGGDECRFDEEAIKQNLAYLEQYFKTCIAPEYVTILRVAGGGHPWIGKVQLLQFHRMELTAWLIFDDRKLYKFGLNRDGTIRTTHEMGLAGLSLEDVIKSGCLQDAKLYRDLSFAVLHDLLFKFEHKWIQRSMGVNLHASDSEDTHMVLPTLTAKLIASLLRDDGSCQDGDYLSHLEDQFLQIIVCFCGVFGAKGAGICGAARRAIATRDYRLLAEELQHIDKVFREELFGYLGYLCVKQQEFLTMAKQNPSEVALRDLRQTRDEIRSAVPQDLEKLKQELVVLLFPEQYPMQEDDTVLEAEVESDYDDDDACKMPQKSLRNVFEDPDLIDRAKKVDLKKFDHYQLF